MRNNSMLAGTIALLMVIAGTGCQGGQNNGSKSAELSGTPKSDAIYQVSLLNGLMLGDYDGTVSVGALHALGDTGIGTFDQLDGEMIFVDGVVYKAKADGSVEIQPDQETVPFAAVTYFDEDIIPRKIVDVQSIEALKTILDQVITEEADDFNRFYVVTLEGSYVMAHVRSVPPQEKPYHPLAEIAKTQVEYTYENLEGTIVAVRCPDYVKGINLPGWHLHFLSGDKTKGGHLLDASLRQGTLKMDEVSEFQLRLPDTEAFADLNLVEDLGKDTKSVESK